MSARVGLFVTGAIASVFSTLESNLRVLGRIYEWARRSAGVDLDDHLTSGSGLDARQIESMVLYFRTRGEGTETVVGSDPGALDHHVSVAENFLNGPG